MSNSQERAAKTFFFLHGTGCLYGRPSATCPWFSDAERINISSKRKRGPDVISTFKIAAVQTAPAFMDREATIAKARELIAEAGQNGASLVVFPEAFVPTYPDWVWRIPPGEHLMLANPS